jgi:hypothetical protein
MANNTSTSKVDVANWRRGYQAALNGEAFVSDDDERTSAWRLGYRDGRASRLKQHVAAKQLDARKPVLLKPREIQHADWRRCST